MVDQAAEYVNPTNKEKGDESKQKDIICFRCKEKGHVAYECGLRVAKNKKNSILDSSDMVDQALCELITLLCATQVAGQGFFLIPNRPSESNARERINTAMVTVVKGIISAKYLEDEFSRIYSDGWRWMMRKVADNIYIVRFPNALMIQEWAYFNPIKMKSVKAKVQIASWNGSVGAKG
jgi:hypothetical protein